MDSPSGPNPSSSEERESDAAFPLGEAIDEVEALALGGDVDMEEVLELGTALVDVLTLSRFP